MKRLLSIILAVVLAAGVAGSAANGTMAGFFDTEASTDNRMCASTLVLKLSGGPIQVEHAAPSQWYSEDYTLTNAGSTDGIGWVHVTNVTCAEDAVGAGIVTSEPEAVAEEGGRHGQVWLNGLGVDCGDDLLGPADLVMKRFLDIEIWFDEDNNGVFETLVASGKLADIECNWYELGVIPSSTPINPDKGSWGTYFSYHIGDPPLRAPLISGQWFPVGEVTVSTVGGNLIVEYDTTGYSWAMEESHLWVDTSPPPTKGGWGHFPYTSNPDNKPPDDTQYSKVIDLYTHRYIIPLSTIGVDVCDDVSIAAHAAGWDDETAWAMGGYRQLRVRLHMPDIDEDDPALGLAFAGVDNDGDGLVDEDGRGCVGDTPGVDDDGDGKIDEDPALDGNDAVLDGGYFDGNDPDIQMKSWDHWPTNAYQGDRCTFDMEFVLSQGGQEPPPP